MVRWLDIAGLCEYVCTRDSIPSMTTISTLLYVKTQMESEMGLYRDGDEVVLYSDGECEALDSVLFQRWGFPSQQGQPNSNSAASTVNSPILTNNVIHNQRQIHPFSIVMCRVMETTANSHG